MRKEMILMILSAAGCAAAKSLPRLMELSRELSKDPGTGCPEFPLPTVQEARESVRAKDVASQREQWIRLRAAQKIRHAMDRHPDLFRDCQDVVDGENEAMDQADAEAMRIYPAPASQRGFSEALLRELNAKGEK